MLTFPQSHTTVSKAISIIMHTVAIAVTLYKVEFIFLVCVCV